MQKIKAEWTRTSRGVCHYSLEATDSGIHHFTLLAKFFQGSPVLRELTKHSTEIGLIVFSTYLKERKHFACMQFNATRILSGPHPTPSLQHVSQVRDSLLNVASPDEQKQMDLLFIFFFLFLEAPWVNFYQEGRKEGPGDFLGWLSSQCPLCGSSGVGGLICQKRTCLWACQSIGYLPVCMHRALSWRVLPDWMM